MGVAICGALASSSPFPQGVAPNGKEVGSQLDAKPHPSGDNLLTDRAARDSPFHHERS